MNNGELKRSQNARKDECTREMEDKQEGMRNWKVNVGIEPRWLQEKRRDTKCESSTWSRTTGYLDTDINLMGEEKS